MDVLTHAQVAVFNALRYVLLIAHHIAMKIAPMVARFLVLEQQGL